MSQTMSQLELVEFRRSFPARRHGAVTPEERQAFAESHPNLEDVIRGVIRGFHFPPEDVDDLTQAVWAKIFLGLTRVRLDARSR